MTYEDLERMYEEMRSRYGNQVYNHISELLQKAKEIHRRDWLRENPNGDHEQSWRAFKGKNLEKLIQHIIQEQVEALGLKVINGNALERSNMLSEELSQVKRNLVVDYGVYGMHLPDVDIIIYNPGSFEVIAVLSCKVTLRERIAQTCYWKLKLLQDRKTRNIMVYFVTPDEDRTLTQRTPVKKGRALVEVDLDGSYIMTEERVEESEKVKLFERFVEDLTDLLDRRR